MKRVLSVILIAMACLAFANELGKKVAKVSMMKGDVVVVDVSGQEKKINKDDWIEEGSVIKTGQKSFAKLSFIDKSTMNVGPKSEMKIEKFNKEEAGVVNVISGKIRAQVTKDYMDMDKEKSKLFVKSKSAVMGIRGTDFAFTTNRKTGATTAVLFEGKVVFNKISKSDNLKNLEAIVNKGRVILPGQFSVVNNKYPRPTVPAKLSSAQLQGLAKNPTFMAVNATESKPLAPPGLSNEIVSSQNDGIKSNSLVHSETTGQMIVTADSKGYVRGADVKPADGAPVDIDTGLIVPLGSDSTFDKSKGEWVSKTVGSVDQRTGEFIPPANYAVTDTGDMVKVNANGTVQVVQIEIKPVDQTPPLTTMPLGQPVMLKDEGRAPAGDGAIIPVRSKDDIRIEVPVEGPAPAGTTETTLVRPPAKCLNCLIDLPMNKTPIVPLDKTRKDTTPVKINVRKGD